MKKAKVLVQESWAKVEPISEQAAALFYDKLFELNPTLKLLFKAPIPVQGKLLMNALGRAVSGLDDLESLVPVLSELGARHAPYGVLAKDYDTVGEAFLWTLSQGLGDAFTDEVKDAWTAVYGVVASVMIEAQGKVDVSGPVSPRERRLVQGSFQLVAPISEQAAEIFYAKLFELDATLKPLFKGDMKEQGLKLMKMLSVAVKGLDKLSEIVPAVQALGERHVGYGVKDEDYDTVGEALIYTLGKGLGDVFTDEVRSAWLTVYGVLAKTMKDAAAQVGDKKPGKPAKSSAPVQGDDAGGAALGMGAVWLLVIAAVGVGFL